MQICGRHFSRETVARIQATVDAEPSLSRRELSRRVCEWLDWRAPNGEHQEVSCRKALAQLSRDGHLKLPELHTTYGFEEPVDNSILELPELPELSCSLAELGLVQIEPVRERRSKASEVWNSLMGHFHYLGRGPLCGAQIRYLVSSPEHGWLGALAFSGAVWSLASRDEHIGWSEAARRANLSRVVCNSRFLILPTVRVPNLASHVLSRCVGQLADDWLERYSYTPVMVESFVDPSRFTGACYRAANWLCVGQTRSRRTPFPNGKLANGPKGIYLYAMHPQWKSVLCAEPDVPLGSTPRPESPADWTEEEFGTVQFFDERLKKRLFSLASDFFAQPGELVPQACNGSMAKTKAAYRFFSNEQVTMQTLLRPHVESTIVFPVTV